MKDLADRLRSYLQKLESDTLSISPKVIAKVRADYLRRLQDEENTQADAEMIDPAMKQMFQSLSELMEEILLRVYTGEFSKDQLLSGIVHLGLIRTVNELMQLFQGLETFRSSIQDLSEMVGIDSSDTTESDSLDINAVLADFDDIDIFADYQDGDETYDPRYDEEDRWVLNELFLMIMDGYIEPIAVGIRSVLAGNTSGKLYKALLSSLQPLQRSAETMGFEHLADALAQLEDALHQAISFGINAKTRILLTQAYGILKKNLQNNDQIDAIDILNSENLSSSFILNLLNAPGIEEWMVQVLIEVGINTIEQLSAASVEDIRAVTGLSFEKSRRILKKCKTVIQQKQHQ